MATATVILFVAASFLILGIKVGAKWQRTVYAEHLPTWHKRPREADRMADTAKRQPDGYRRRLAAHKLTEQRQQDGALNSVCSLLLTAC